MKTAFRFILPLLFLPIFVSATTPSAYRIIAILENERILDAEPDVTLVSFFEASDAQIRARAILAAARIGNPDVISDLKKCAKDPVGEVRKLVAFALGQIRSKEGLSVTLGLLKDEDPEVRRLAIDATGRIGGLEVTGFLLPFLEDADSRLREQTALSLALIKDKTSVDSLIRKIGDSPKDPAQWAYVYALYRLADERAVETLHRVLAGPADSPSTGDPSSLLFALKALWTLKKALTEPEADRLLQHGDPRVQQNALDTLAAAGDASACVAISRHYGAMNQISKWKAIETMGILKCKLPDVDAADPTLYGARLQAMAKAEKDAGLPQLTAAAENADWMLRWRVAQAMADIKADSAIPVLKILSMDKDSAVRLAALDSLASFGAQSAELFVPLLKDDDFAVRATAADALGKTKERKYLPLLIDTYRRSSASTEIEGRIAVLDVLADYNSSDVIGVYQEALNDPDYAIRSHAIEGLRKLVGSQMYWNGKVVDPQQYLYRKDKLSKSVIDSYPPDFGEPVADAIAEVTLEKGPVEIRLLGAEAPLLVANFIKLAKRGFYNGLRIHRVVPNFVIQGGDPRGDGWGGAGEVIRDQINRRIYQRGMVGLPIAGKDTGGSQFFITMSRQPHLDGNYSIFGEVVSGMQFVDSTTIGDKILKIQIKKSPTNSNKSK